MEPLGGRARRDPRRHARRAAATSRGLALIATLALPTTTAAAPGAAQAPPWPRWEIGGQLSLLAHGDQLALRVRAGGGRYLGRHLLEAHCAASRVLSSTTVDLDAAYALHLRWRRLLGFFRGGGGLRIEQAGGGLHRARGALLAGVGLKVRLAGPLALRSEIEYRHLTGAPGVASELALLLGLAALW